jgi:hypothetical protein
MEFDNAWNKTYIVFLLVHWKLSKNTTKSDVSVENIGLKRQGGYFPKSQPSSFVGYNMYECIFFQ